MSSRVCSTGCLPGYLCVRLSLCCRETLRVRIVNARLKGVIKRELEIKCDHGRS